MSEEARKRAKAAYDAAWFVEAPVIVVACGVPREGWRRADGEEYWKVDVAIAMQSLILTATDLDLGTCWTANFNEEAAKMSLEIPGSWRVVAMTPIGYPAEEKQAVRDRKHSKEIVFLKD